jgi:hypothetical protein
MPMLRNANAKQQINELNETDIDLAIFPTQKLICLTTTQQQQQQQQYIVLRDNE